jgi:hypothetical protein
MLTNNPFPPYDHAREDARFDAWYRRAGWDRDHPPGSAQYYAQKAAWLACARTQALDLQRVASLARDVIKARAGEVGT